ncbi:MAG TPA: LytTR family DNA-binding domain-containing protein [Bacteroidota bacterium]|nr:LytTR family DNA-binding domain-containing protein [Bacteroidota bacterium]
MAQKLRTIIIDDERLARKDLRSLLEEHAEIEIVGEADSVDSAIELHHLAEPDLIFLDIQMPGETGFDFLNRCEISADVIFVTAYDEFAIRAFEVGAVDYLMKPVNPARLAAAIKRLDAVDAPVPPQCDRPLDYDDALLLTINSRLKFVRLKNIRCIQASGDYTELHTVENQKGMVLKTMGEWERRLPEKYFCRIHRSTIVNIEQIVQIDEWFGNSYKVYLQGMAAPLTMSRRNAALLKSSRT